MNISDKMLERLTYVTAITACAAWPVVILLAGILSKSLLNAFFLLIAGAVYLFGANKVLGLGSYDRKYSPLRFFYGACILTGLLVALIVLSGHSLGWMWALLFALQVAMFVLYIKMKTNEERILDTLWKEKRERESRVQMASQATNIQDYARALGLNVISSGGAVRDIHLSQFAGQLRCQHCNQIQAAREWPLNGDIFPFYYQKQAGKYNLKMTCPACGLDWYVAWDEDPGKMLPL
jgi:hypothetical protein